MTIRFVLVLSDIHLAPTFESDQLLFRNAAFSPAIYLSQTIDRALEEARAKHATLEIVLNGDVFDFDIAQTAAEAASASRSTVSTSSSTSGPPSDVRTEAGATQVLVQILDDHLPFVMALRRALHGGASVVFLPGNHDSQLALPSVQLALRIFIGAEIRFEPWYHLAAEGAVLVEHGHQYDPLCVVSRLLPSGPTVTLGRGRVESTVGTVSSFYAPLLLPGMDPYAIDPFAERRTLREVTAHAMAKGGPFLACAGELLIAGTDRPPPDDAEALARTLGVSEELVHYRRQFFAPKATLGQVFAACIGSMDYGRSVQASIERAMMAAISVHGAGIAVVGHTHHPGIVTLPNGRLLLNSGSWTPRRTREEPVGSFSWIEVDDHGHVTNATVKPMERSS